MKVSVKVQVDYLESLARSRKPIFAIAELIWNALDADATEVRVDIIENEFGVIDKVVVNDNGHGIHYSDAAAAFENLGGSWKKRQARTKIKKRILHGKAGKGRFRAFSIGTIIEWVTDYKENGRFMTYKITGNRSNLREFQIDDPIESPTKRSGTRVEISEFVKNYPSLIGESAKQELAEHFALYIREYPDISIWYTGEKIEPSSLEERVEDYEIRSVEITDGSKIDAILTIIEWKASVGRSLFLCDVNGFSLEQTTPGIQASGFNFTAYLKSDLLRRLDDENNLVLDEIHPDLNILLEITKEKLREHFRRRAAENAINLVEEWRKEEIYPFEGEPKNIIEKTERQVFDVCALSINSYLPDFEKSEKKSKKFALGLLKQALESNPRALQRILTEVLELPLDKQEEFAQLLEKTTLTAIINASKLVANRLDFLKGLEILLFDPKSREALLERKQLHRILANETWIFGEEFNLTLDDQSLDEVLKKHLELLERNELAPEPVLTAEGKSGIVDLMLSRIVPQPKADEREHLVIELKRPSKSIDFRVIEQITNYATAVASDERFKDTNTKWVFWAISNDVSERVRQLCKQRNRPEGIFHEADDLRLCIWVKSWGQIIEGCRACLHFFQEQLEYSADQDSALTYLHKMHEKYLPECLSKMPTK